MMEPNKFKLGMFVTLAIVLFTLSISFMGLFDSLIKPRAYMATFVEESVQGLNSGSAVKFRGVPIGKVSDITIIMKSQTIRIDMTIDLSKFKTQTGKNLFSQTSITSHNFYEYLLGEINKGLRARIEPDGITGVKYVEIDFFKDVDQKAQTVSIFPPGLQQGIFYMPSTPSMLSSLRLNMTEILANIASIDFRGISQGAVVLLENANKTLTDAKLSGLMENANQVIHKVSKTVDNLNGALTEEKLSELLKEANQTVQEIRRLAENMDRTVKESKVPQTTSSIRTLSDSLTQSDSNIKATIQKLNEALDAMTDLIQYINDNPASILHGKERTSRTPQ